MKIKEVIVVEGKNDTNKLKSILDCDTVETCGTHLSKSVLNQLKAFQKTRGIIVFTDPDAPGEMIRTKINEEIPNAKNAFIMKENARTSKKVGIEHASQEDIIASLTHLMTYDHESEKTMSWEMFNELGLNGKENSAKLREQVGNVLYLGKCNAKTLYKRINMLKLTKEQVEKVIEDIYE